MGGKAQRFPVNSRIIVRIPKNAAISQKATTATLRSPPGLPGFHVFAAVIAASDAIVNSPVVTLSPATYSTLPNSP